MQSTNNTHAAPQPTDGTAGTGDACRRTSACNTLSNHHAPHHHAPLKKSINFCSRLSRNIKLAAAALQSPCVSAHTITPAATFPNIMYTSKPVQTLPTILPPTSPRQALQTQHSSNHTTQPPLSLSTSTCCLSPHAAQSTSAFTCTARQRVPFNPQEQDTMTLSHMQHISSAPPSSISPAPQLAPGTAAATCTAQQRSG